MPLAAKRRIWSLRRRCHAVGWAHGRVAKRPFRETCRWASPSLLFRLHVLLAPLCAYPPRFLSRCGCCATPHCLPLREKHLAPAAQLLFRLRGSLCGCSARLRASCHAAGWAHGRVAKRPFREKCRWASPSLFFRLHVLLAPLCAYPPRFLSRCVPSATGNCLLLRRKYRWPAASLFFGLRSSLLPCSRALRASTYTYPKSGRPGRG